MGWNRSKLLKSLRKKGGRDYVRYLRGSNEGKTIIIQKKDESHQ